MWIGLSVRVMSWAQSGRCGAIVEGDGEIIRLAISDWLCEGMVKEIGWDMR